MPPTPIWDPPPGLKSAKNAPGNSDAPSCAAGCKKNAKVRPHGAPGGPKAPKMTSKWPPGVPPELLFYHRGAKRRTFTKLRYLPSITHLGRVPGPLFFAPFLPKCRPSGCKKPRSHKNSKKGAPGRRRGRQRAPKVSQGDPNWGQSGAQNRLKIHPLRQCLPRGGPKCDLSVSGGTSPVPKHAFLDTFPQFRLQPQLD